MNQKEPEQETPGYWDNSQTLEKEAEKEEALSNYEKGIEQG